jgi:hypothetical protein
VQQILDTAKQLPMPEDADVEVFLDETTIQYDEDSQTVQTRNVYRILTEAGINSCGTVSATWTPWNEKRPTIQVRVINSDGNEKQLIEREIADIPAEQGGNIFSDERRVQAPLPAVQGGSIVETMTLVTLNPSAVVKILNDLVEFTKNLR